MNFFRFEFALFIMHVAVVQAFQPSLTRLIALRSAAMDSSILHSAYDPVSDMDLDHAHDCAENFGKCAIGDLEDMTKALKTERIQHGSLGTILDPQEEVDHRLLEEDLTLQIALLKGEMPTTPLYNLENSGVMPAPNSAVATIANPDYYHHDHTLRDYVEQGEELFLMPNGVAETFAFGASLFIIAMSPLMFQH